MPEAIEPIPSAREITLREYLERAIADVRHANERDYVVLRELMDQRYLSQERAISKAETTQDARLDEMNNLREQIGTERGLYVQRELLDSVVSAIDARLSAREHTVDVMIQKLEDDTRNAALERIRTTEEKFRLRDERMDRVDTFFRSQIEVVQASQRTTDDKLREEMRDSFTTINKALDEMRGRFAAASIVVGTVISLTFLAIAIFNIIRH